MSRRYWQLDVFAERPLTGNGLAVFDDASALDDAAMQAWTRELRQFESIFLLPGDDPRAFRARIFTLEEELPFAGHPLLGAAALLHHLRGGDNEQHWTLHLASKSVALRSVRGRAAVSTPRWTRAAPNSAPPRTPGPAAGSAEAFSLSANDLSGHPPRVVSTGLPYLLLPVTAEALGRARQVNDLQEALDKLGAAFVYLLDVDGREGRTWDNLGLVEDVATGSAAGPVAAYLVEYGLAARGEPFVLHQGRFLERPSRLDVQVATDGSVRVGGHVQLLARAELLTSA
ncbi:PhzF family phenazine biosynthesis protein [Pseudomonas aeruginosa]|nr:PhzF family phenazine biosynthesis protein [Pseudomonas aeruginosa]